MDGALIGSYPVTYPSLWAQNVVIRASCSELENDFKYHDKYTSVKVICLWNTVVKVPFFTEQT